MSDEETAWCDFGNCIEKARVLVSIRVIRDDRVEQRPMCEACARMAEVIYSQNPELFSFAGKVELPGSHVK